MVSSKRKSQSIVYVNFAPYENAGRILDYLLSQYVTVISFRFNFHRLSGTHDKSCIKEYKNGKIQTSRFLYYLPTPPNIGFLILPIRSVIIFIQIILYLFIMKKKYKTLDLYFTVNAFTAWCGIIGKRIGLVQKTIFWIWDYYPPFHTDKIVMFMRRLYWLFDKPATMHADRIVFLNKRLEDLRKNMGILLKNTDYPVVGIGTDPIRTLLPKPQNPISFVFLGVLKKSQGLDLFFNAAPSLAKIYPNAVLHIIGSGPDEGYFTKRISSCPIRVICHGYTHNDKTINTIMRSCHIGIAPYVPDRGNVTYYSDPSKIKSYLSAGLPVITTNVFYFSKIIKKTHAGVIVPYEKKAFVKATGSIMKKYRFYQKNSLALGKRFAYRKIYPLLFKDPTPR